jgi:hypothetical protein
MKAEVGMKVKARKSYCVGIIIDKTEWNGEIVKVNAKSIRVRLTDTTSTYGSKVTSHYDMNTEITYKFVKVLSDGRSWYRSDAETYGSIDI